jgi:spermidine/putrescine-binding protein
MERSSRRSYIKATGVAISAMALGGCAGETGTDTSGNNNGETEGATTSSSSDFANELNIATWGGTYTEATQQAYFEPFSDEHGVEINTISLGNIYDLYTKIEQGTSDVDIILGSDFAIPEAVERGILAEWNLDNIPNIKNMSAFTPEEVTFDPGIHSIVHDFLGGGLFWRDDMIDEPNTWDDLWVDDLEGQLAFRGEPVQYMVAILASDLNININEINQNYETKMDEIWSRLDEIEPLVREFAGGPTELQELAANEAATAGGALWFGRTSTVDSENDFPIKYKIPEEGTFAVSTPWNLTTNAAEDPKRNTAEKFVNFTLTEEPSIEWANTLPFAQPIEFENTPDVYVDHPDIENRDKLTFFKPGVWDPHLEEMQTEFLSSIRS